MSTLNLEGDGQADLTVHGGTSKAVYVYPAEHYDFWRGELPDMKLSWGHFGENLTTRGLLEDAVHIGDVFRIGSALTRVTEPRMPCFKLGIRFGRADMVKLFLAARRTGFYLAVLEEGAVEAGDSFVRVERSEHGVRVADITRLYAVDREDWATMRRVIEVETLPENWRGYFQNRLERA